MIIMTVKKSKEKPKKLIKAPVCLSSIEDINIAAIISEFTIKRKSGYSLPRIAFIGYFSCLSLTDQRHIAKAIGFEYYQGIKFGDTSEKSLQILVGKWAQIYKEFTRLIVLGDKTINGWSDGIPKMGYESDWHLFRSYQKNPQPIFAENNIPIIMESELFKLHPEYPQ